MHNAADFSGAESSDASNDEELSALDREIKFCHTEISKVRFIHDVLIVLVLFLSKQLSIYSCFEIMEQKVFKLTMVFTGYMVLSA